MLSLVIPTRDRSSYLARALRYYVSLGFDCPIVVADSSSPSERAANIRAVGSARGQVEVRHVAFDPGLNFYSKIARAVATVDTKYAVLCSDKDFLVPLGIRRSMQYLEANPKYSITQGRSVLIAQVEVSSLNRGFGAYTWSGRRRQLSIDSDRPLERLEEHLRHNAGTFYAVHRRQDLLRNMQLAAKETKDLRFGELLPSCLSVIQGKAHVLDVMYLVRHYRPDISSAMQPVNRVSTWLATSDFSERYARFRQTLAEELFDVAGLNQGESERLIDRAFGAYREESLTKWDGSSNHSGKAWRLKRAVRRARHSVQLLPDAARVALLDRRLRQMLSSPRSAYRALQHERKLRTRADAISVRTLLEQESPHRADFLPIYESVTRYPDGIESPQPA